MYCQKCGELVGSSVGARSRYTIKGDVNAGGKIIPFAAPAMAGAALGEITEFSSLTTLHEAWRREIEKDTTGDVVYKFTSTGCVARWQNRGAKFEWCLWYEEATHA
jgi:hypothetical protein